MAQKAAQKNAQQNAQQKTRENPPAGSNDSDNAAAAMSETEEQKVELKLVRPARLYGDSQDVGKTFELPEREAAALVGTGAAEYVGTVELSEDAKSVEKAVGSPTRRRGSRSRGKADPRAVHQELGGASG